MIGKSVSHYRIIENLSQGGMGEVFLTHDTSLDRNGALEFHLIFSPLIAYICRYFDHKVRLLASLNNENLLPVNDHQKTRFSEQSPKTGERIA